MSGLLRVTVVPSISVTSGLFACDAVLAIAELAQEVATSGGELVVPLSSVVRGDDVAARPIATTRRAALVRGQGLDVGCTVPTGVTTFITRGRSDREHGGRPGPSSRPVWVRYHIPVVTNQTFLAQTYHLHSLGIALWTDAGLVRSDHLRH